MYIYITCIFLKVLNKTHMFTYMVSESILSHVCVPHVCCMCVMCMSLHVMIGFDCFGSLMMRVMAFHLARPRRWQDQSPRASPHWVFRWVACTRVLEAWMFAVNLKASHLKAASPAQHEHACWGVVAFCMYVCCMCAACALCVCHSLS